MARPYVQEFELVIEDLFNELFPRAAPGLRATKPLLAPSLGCLVRGKDLRILQRRREYHRLDFLDFVDFATSKLPSRPRLVDFVDGQAGFYEGFDRRPTGPLFEAQFLSSKVGLSILDAAVAREEFFVSVTMRFAIFLNPKEAFGTQYDENDSDENPPLYQLVTVTFAPPRPADDRPPDMGTLERIPLEEWDRYFIAPPVPGDREWRFTMSGTYTGYLLDDMARNPHGVGSARPDQIALIRSKWHENYKEKATYFELARLALHLPAYFAFMYDLVIHERVEAGTGRRPRRRKGGRRRPKALKDQPIYRLIKSINITYDHEATGQEKHTRAWTAPAYSFAVSGHWRHYKDPAVKGHDPIGGITLGKTWITQYAKYKGKGPFPFATTSAAADPKVVIKIKQPLAYARDIMKSHAQGKELREQTGAVADPAVAQACKGKENKGLASGKPSMHKPSKEWKMHERSKLSAAMRYAILRRDGFRCQLCGRSAPEDDYVRLEVDHITPVDQWGRTVEANLRTLCRECNRGKSNRSAEQSVKE